MKRTIGLLAALTLAVAPAVALSTAAPAAASGCGNTVVTPTTLQGWNFVTDTRTAGSVTFAETGGLTVAVTEQSSQGKATGTYAITGGLPLSGQTAQSNYGITTDQGADAYVRGFSYQLQIDRDANGTRDEFLVYEPAFYGAGVWHTNTAGSQLGYRFTGDLDDYVAQSPDARILAFGFTLGSGVPPVSTRVDQVKFGCNTFSFARDAVVPNVAPTADFTGTQADLTASFVDQSTDSDGTIVSRAWSFGDDGTSTDTNPSHTYTAAGTYDVTLTVTDDDGATGTVTKKVTVQAPRPVDTVNTTNLPNTGASVIGIGVAALALLGIGGGAVVAGRRKRTNV